jgi:hypothetical protein
MYAWIFRRLPGPLWLRILTSLVLLAAVLLALANYVFPWLSTLTPFTDSTIGSKN